MILYFATNTPLEVPNVLMSYYMLQNNKKLLEFAKTAVRRRMFLDSGAYSAFTKNITIDIDEYVKFVKETQLLWTVVAGLDVIGDWKATQKNLEYIESQGIRVLPTFHYGSPIEELDRMLEKYDYIALGGLVPLAIQKRKLGAWLNYCWSRIIKHQPLKKIHGFGINALWAMKKYPFYSVDATSWNQGAKFGMVYKTKQLQNVKVDKRNPIDNLTYYHNKSYKVRTQQNIKTLLDLESEITKLWEYRGIKFNE